MSGDNTSFDMTACNLEDAMRISSSKYKTATHWKEKDNTLIFAWTDGNVLIPFPTPIDYEEATVIARRWLEEKAEYGRQSDHDGDNGKSNRVYCDDWGHVDNDYKCFAVEPVWEMYGK